MTPMTQRFDGHSRWYFWIWFHPLFVCWHCAFGWQGGLPRGHGEWGGTNSPLKMTGIQIATVKHEPEWMNEYQSWCRDEWMKRGRIMLPKWRWRNVFCTTLLKGWGWGVVPEWGNSFCDCVIPLTSLYNERIRTTHKSCPWRWLNQLPWRYALGLGFIHSLGSTMISATGHSNGFDPELKLAVSGPHLWNCWCLGHINII